MHRGLAFLPALPILAACGTFRAYDGPDLSPEDVARISEDFDGHGFVPFDITAVEILAVDGVSIVEHSGGTVVVLPGVHTLEVQGRMVFPPEGIYVFPRGCITLDARAGGKYGFDIVTIGPGSHTTAIILLCDSDTGNALGDTMPSVEMARTATLDFGGPTRPVADWSRIDDAAWTPTRSTTPSTSTCSPRRINGR